MTSSTTAQAGTEQAAAGTKKLSVSQKLRFASCDLGGALSYNSLSFYLLFYLIEIVGVRPSLAGLVLISGRIFDAVIDPLMGVVTDRTRSRWGRRKPYIVLGAIPCGASFALLWMLPDGSENTKFYLSMVAVFIHMLFYSIVTIPATAMTPELTTDYNERTSFTSYRTGFSVIGSLLAAAIPPGLVAAVNHAQGYPEKARFGWGAMGALFGAFIIGGCLITGLSIPPGIQATNEPPKKLDIFGEYRAVFRVYGYPQLLAMFFVVTTSVGSVSAILPFYLTAALGLPANTQSAILGMVFTISVFSLPLWTTVAAKMGKRKGLVLGLILYSSALLLQTTFAPRGYVSPTLIATAILLGVASAGMMLFPWAMLPDVVEFDELASGERREGVIYALFTLIVKVAYALGAFFNAQALDFFGYSPSAVEQSERAVFGIKFMMGPAVTVFIVLAAVLAWRYPITQEKHAEVQAALARRREEQARALAA